MIILYVRDSLLRINISKTKKKKTVPLNSLWFHFKCKMKWRLSNYLLFTTTIGWCKLDTFICFHNVLNSYQDWVRDSMVLQKGKWPKEPIYWLCFNCRKRAYVQNSRDLLVTRLLVQALTVEHFHILLQLPCPTALFCKKVTHRLQNLARHISHWTPGTL